MSTRIEWIDSAKGFTMLLVIIGHCLDGYIQANLFQEHRAWMQWLHSFIYSFHMPLFFILSGFLYYYSYEKYSLKRLIPKALDLIIIYFGYSIVQCFVQIIMSGNVNRSVSLTDILRLPFYTVAPYWYLYVLFFLYILSYWLKPLNKIKVFSAAILCLASVFVPTIKFLSLSNIAYYLFFFTCGGVIALLRIDLKLKKIYLLPIVFAYFLMWHIGISNEISRPFFAIILSALTLTVFCSIKKANEIFVLNLCGKYCLPIYLIHCYLTAGTRIILQKFHVEPFYLYLVSGTVLGIIIPIAVYKVCMSSDKLHWIFKPLDSWAQYKN